MSDTTDLDTLSGWPLTWAVASARGWTVSSTDEGTHHHLDPAGQPGDPPDYAGDMGAAWKLIAEECDGNGFGMSGGQPFKDWKGNPIPNSAYQCEFYVAIDSRRKPILGCGDTAPVAICRAWLRARQAGR